MNILTGIMRVCLLVCASGLLLWDGVAAQDTRFRGRIIDAQGQPVPSLTVSLHRVTRNGGAVTTQALSGREGEFTFSIQTQSTDSEAVFFVATRYLGQLYLGQPFRQLVPTTGDYTVLVGAGGVTASGFLNPAAAPKVEQRPVTLSTQTVLLLLAITFGTLALVAAGLAGNAPQRARKRRRASLLQLARLEEKQSNSAEHGELNTRRNDLLRRIHSMPR